ncbi:MAG TPA: hypothetical protein VEJ16_01945 [Alphaproteobacteria bacterium]|nr:hypothetical protein [Alphaproteobacteria bacterium]
MDFSQALTKSDAFDVTGDGTAIARVASLIRQRGYEGFGVELWQDTRLVHREGPIAPES